MLNLENNACAYDVENDPGTYDLDNLSCNYRNLEYHVCAHDVENDPGTYDLDNLSCNYRNLEHHTCARDVENGTGTDDLDRSCNYRNLEYHACELLDWVWVHARRARVHDFRRLRRERTGRVRVWTLRVQHRVQRPEVRLVRGWAGWNRVHD